MTRHSTTLLFTEPDLFLLRRLPSDPSSPLKSTDRTLLAITVLLYLLTSTSWASFSSSHTDNPNPLREGDSRSFKRYRLTAILLRN